MFIETVDYEMRLYWENRRAEAEKRSLQRGFKSKIFSRIKAYGEPPREENDPMCIRRPWSKMGAYIQKPARKWIWFDDSIVLNQFSEDVLLDILESRARESERNDTENGRRIPRPKPLGVETRPRPLREYRKKRGGCD